MKRIVWQRWDRNIVGGKKNCRRCVVGGGKKCDFRIINAIGYRRLEWMIHVSGLLGTERIYWVIVYRQAYRAFQFRPRSYNYYSRGTHAFHLFSSPLALSYTCHYFLCRSRMQREILFSWTDSNPRLKTQIRVSKSRSSRETREWKYIPFARGRRGKLEDWIFLFIAQGDIASRYDATRDLKKKNRTIYAHGWMIRRWQATIQTMN